MKNDLTEKEVLRFFNKKKQELQKELEKVEMAISAIGGYNITATPPAAKEKVAAKKPAAKKEVARTPKAKKRLEKRDNYKATDKLDDKIAYALTQVGKGNKQQILDVIKENEPAVDVEKLDRTLSVRFSYLIKHDMIKGQKTGRSYTYKLY